MLEIVITGRHDNYGGVDFQDRLCAAAAHNHRLLDRLGVPHTFTFVEWNPWPGRRLLSEIIRDRLPWWHQCLVIDPVWHEHSSTNPRLQFMEFFGKNAAIRRSQADAILTTNSDVFLSTEVVQKLVGLTLDDRTIYRAVRMDIDRSVDWRTCGEDVLADPAWRLRVNDVQPPEYGNSAGDFLLLSKAAWFAIGGFNERVRYAKIHKDGQFCVNGRLEGYAFDVLGPIYHIDHDGSYANAGAMRGSPDAPYGPEWDYRQRYRNAKSWGLAAGIDRADAPGMVFVKHPSTHGPLLSVIAVGNEQDAAAVNDALATAAGRFVAIARDQSLAAFGGRDAVDAALRQTTADILVPSGTLTTHPTLGPIPAHDTPVIYRRRIIDALTDLEQSEADAALAFWLRAAEHGTVAEIGTPDPQRRIWERRVSPATELRVLSRRGIPAPSTVLSAAIAERRTSSRDMKAFVAQWIAAAVPEPGAACAVIGPDWATEILIGEIAASGRRFAGLFTADASEERTWRWGEHVRPLPALQALPSGTYVLTGCENGVGERMAEQSLSVSLHALAADGDEETDRAAGELDLIRRAQARDLAQANLDRVIARLPIIALLEGERAYQHLYDAAALCDRLERRDTAETLFREVHAGAETDRPLRMRAAFHLARLCLDRGNTTEAGPLLAAVLEHNPDHRAARALVERTQARGRERLSA